MTPNGVVIPDVRFQNELDAIRAAGGKVWGIVAEPRLDGSGLLGEAAAHSSEAGLKVSSLDGIIHNRYDIYVDLDINLATFQDDVEFYATVAGLKVIKR